MVLEALGRFIKQYILGFTFLSRYFLGGVMQFCKSSGNRKITEKRKILQLQNFQEITVL